MKCKCSLTNNYKIVGLCDIKKFNEKIGEFNDQSWTQISVPEKLILPDNLPDVKNVMKVYINVKITFTKIINTSSSEIPNTEGLKLTGKILLTSGIICQKIIYTAENISQSMHSVKFNIPFNTYIVINKNTDIDNDKFCVYPCVEDVSVRILNKRVLSKSVNLFLFAHKTSEQTIPLPSIEQTKIIIKSKNNEEVATIEFNKEESKFIVTSTGIVPDQDMSEPYFTLILRDADYNSNDILKVVLNSNENANDFKANLNDKKFEYDNNRLILIYKDKTKIEIENYPNQGEQYIPNEYANLFEITKNGLIDKSFNSKIKIFNDDNNEVAGIQFLDIPTPNKRVFVTSTGEISTNALTNTELFSQFIHYITGFRFNAVIFGNRNANSFVNKANNKIVNYSMPMKLSNKISDRIVITNYNAQSEYKIGEEPEFFKQEGKELLPYDLEYNKITLKNKDNTNVLFIYFDKKRNIFFIHSTGVINVDSDKFTIKLTDSKQTTIKLEKSISKSENADSINTQILERFVFDDVLELSYSDGKLVEISDIPRKGSIYNPTGISKKFRITQTGLQVINL